MATEAAEVHGIAALLLVLRREGKKREAQTYYVSRIWDHPAVPGPVFRLRKAGAEGEERIVALTVHGPECDCEDATYRGRACKHIRGMEAVGLLRRKG